MLSLRSRSATVAWTPIYWLVPTLRAYTGSRVRFLRQRSSRTSNSRSSGAFPTFGPSREVATIPAPAGVSRPNVAAARFLAVPTRRIFRAVDFAPGSRLTTTSSTLPLSPPSRWIAGHARRSHFFGGRRIEYIPTGVDLTIFRPQDRSAARLALGLPTDRKLILFGALAATADPRKGFHHLKVALQVFKDLMSTDATTVIVFGAPQDALSGIDLPFPTINVGSHNEEEKLGSLLAAGDVFAAPFAEDNLPNVVLEALACGTPVAAFAAGGIPDAVEHKQNGFLSRRERRRLGARPRLDLERRRASRTPVHWGTLNRAIALRHFRLRARLQEPHR